MCRLRKFWVRVNLRAMLFGPYAARRQLPNDWLEFRYSFCPLNRHDDISHEVGSSLRVKSRKK